MTAATNPPRHPTMRYPARHPKAGLALEALGVMPNGRIVWPIMGASPEGDGAGGGQGGNTGAGAQGGSGQGGQGAGGNTAGQAGQGGQQGSGQQTGSNGNAVDANGNDLGYPANTRVAEMTDKQAASYWKHHAQKHEGRYQSLVGSRSYDETRAALDEHTELKKAQQTPAEQALTAKYDDGVKAGTQQANRTAAKAIFRGALEAGGVTGDDLDELMSNFNVDGYVTDQGIDTAKITGFARRFTPATGTQQQRRRDFGAGHRGDATGKAGDAGRAQLEKRGFVKTN